VDCHATLLPGSCNGERYHALVARSVPNFTLDGSHVPEWSAYAPILSVIADMPAQLPSAIRGHPGSSNFDRQNALHLCRIDKRRRNTRGIRNGPMHVARMYDGRRDGLIRLRPLTSGVRRSIASDPLGILSDPLCSIYDVGRECVTDSPNSPVERLVDNLRHFISVPT
jgi:hypothetical protein